MPFVESESLRLFTFRSLAGCGVAQAVFTRRGGVSQTPWASLNVGSTVGDHPAHVLENRHRAFHSMGRAPDSLYDVWQVHGREVVCVDKPRPADAPHIKADTILTDRRDVTLFMRFADCVPILLADPVRRVVGLVHAGWQGTVKRAAQAAVEAMQTRYGSNPADIRACIGPSIGPDHYEIGPDVAAQVRTSFNGQAERLLLKHNGRVHLDLWTANRLTLQEAGVLQIEVSEICTACHTEDWYSHRREHGRTGRFGVLLALT